MNDSDLILIGFILLSLVGLGISFLIFGVEMPVYLAIAVGGISVYIFSDNPILQVVFGWIGRLAAVLFIVSMIYYIGTGTFFPKNPTEFRFLSVGISFLGDLSDKIGNFVLGFFK